MVRLKRQFEGLVEDEVGGKLRILRIVFSAIISFIAVSGLVGVVIFSLVHWTSFS